MRGNHDERVRGIPGVRVAFGAAGGDDAAGFEDDGDGLPGAGDAGADVVVDSTTLAVKDEDVVRSVVRGAAGEVGADRREEVVKVVVAHLSRSNSSMLGRRATSLVPRVESDAVVLSSAAVLMSDASGADVGCSGVASETATTVGDAGDRPCSSASSRLNFSICVRPYTRSSDTGQ